MTFKQKVVEEIVDKETNKVKNESKEIKIEPYQFTISKCNGKLRLQHATIKDFKNGSRYSLTKEKELVKVLKTTGAWKLISR